MLLSADATKKLPITAVDGRLLLTDNNGEFIVPDRRPVSMNNFRQPVDTDDSQLPTDGDGIFVLGKEKTHSISLLVQKTIINQSSRHLYSHSETCCNYWYYQSSSRRPNASNGQHQKFH